MALAFGDEEGMDRRPNVSPYTPISLFKIGVPLIEAGHSEELIRIGTLHPERD